MLSLGIDTSNYATSLAVVDPSAREVVCASKRFLPVKPGQIGLRQSDALFLHTVALPEMLEDLAKKVDFQQIDFIGVSAKPRPVDGSYMPCFLAGVNTATAIALAKHCKPIVTSHQQGHIAAALFYVSQQIALPQEAIVFHVSGGTTDMMLYRGMHSIEPIGSSTDLYAGQAIDRLGCKLGFPFPAGVEVTRLASQCEEKVPVKSSVSGLNCSLSGLENQCEALLKKGFSKEYVCKYCLLCVAQTIVKMAKNARLQYPEMPVLCAGGVMSSDIIARYVKARLENVWFVPSLYSSDNAIGVAAIAGGVFG